MITGVEHRVYPNKDMYSGDWSLGFLAPHGVGTMHFNAYKDEVLDPNMNPVEHCIASYTGDWLNGQMTGFGSLLYNYGSQKDCQRYEGYWVNGLRQGYGCETLPLDSLSYCGEWYEDKKHGFGSLTWFGTLIDEDTYTFAQEEDVDYDVQYEYVGEWANGKRNGYGVMVTYRRDYECNSGSHWARMCEYTTGTWSNGVCVSMSMPALRRSCTDWCRQCFNVSTTHALMMRLPEICDGCGRMMYVPNGSFPRIANVWQDKSVEDAAKWQRWASVLDRVVPDVE